MAIAENYTTVILREVPRMTMERRDVLRRFILLIDQLYYNLRKVVIEAEVPLDDLFEQPKE